MIQEKERNVEVTINNNGKEEKVKICVKRPSAPVLRKAQLFSSKIWTECLRDGIMTKKELSKFMEAQGIWNKGKDTEQDKIMQEIANLEKELAIGKSGKNKVKSSHGKDIAITIRQKRAELRDLIAERLSLENNTAESLADNARFDFIVANSTFYENGEKVYKSLDDYMENSDSEVAFAAANAMAQMMYALDKDFELRLPENAFLKKHNYINEDGALVNEKGEMVDLDGRRINEFGHYINDEGKRVDIDGNLLDEEGHYIPSVTYVEDSKTKNKSDG